MLGERDSSGQRGPWNSGQAIAVTRPVARTAQKYPAATLGGFEFRSVRLKIRSRLTRGTSRLHQFSRRDGWFALIPGFPALGFPGNGYVYNNSKFRIRCRDD